MRRTLLFSFPRGFDRDLKLLLFSMASRRIVMGFMEVVRAIYFALLGFSPLTIGLLLSFSIFISAIHHISFGVLSDRYGRKPFLMLGAVFATCRLVIFATTRNFWLLALGQGLGAMGEGAGAGQPVVSGYIADKVEIERRVSIFSTLAITNSIATAVGAAIAGFPQLFTRLLGLDLVSAHALLFWMGVVFSALSFILLFPINDVAVAKGMVEKQRMFKVKSWGVILRFSLVRTTSGFGWGLIGGSLLTLYFYLRFGVGSDVMGPIFSATRLISILTYLLIPATVARLGEVGTLTWSRLVSAAFTITFAFSNWYPLSVILLVVLRILIMFPMPIRQSFATGIVDAEETATAIGISNFARMGVRSVAPTITGYMFEAVSLSMPFLMAATLLAMNGILYHTYFRHTKRQE